MIINLNLNIGLHSMVLHGMINNNDQFCARDVSCEQRISLSVGINGSLHSSHSASRRRSENEA